MTVKVEKEIAGRTLTIESEPVPHNVVLGLINITGSCVDT